MNAFCESSESWKSWESTWGPGRRPGAARSARRRGEPSGARRSAGVKAVRASVSERCLDAGARGGGAPQLDKAQ